MEKVFTTFLATYIAKRRSVAVFRLKQHLERLNRNGAAMWNNSLPLPLADVRSQVGHALQGKLIRQNDSSWKVRVIWDGENFQIETEPYYFPWANHSGIKVVPAKLERLRAKIKIYQDTACVKAHTMARDFDADEALLIDREGIVREGCCSNIFWFDKGGELYTIKDLILEGVTRQALLEMREVKLVSINQEELLTEACEIFVTQSTSGITSVSQLGSKNFEQNFYTTALKQEFINKVEMETEILELA